LCERSAWDGRTVDVVHGQTSFAFDSVDDRKARGAFFTPVALAEFVTEWALRTSADRVLEPSCGEAAFLSAAGRRLRALGGRGALFGLDVHPPSIRAARRLLDHQGLSAELRVADFFEEAKPPRGFDVVIGNPPYIRYQSFSGKERASAQQAALAQGVRLSGLANAWAAFVVHAASFLSGDGRLALVLPASLLSVNYAAPVRRFLLSRFSAVKLVLFEERVFPDVLEEVVLLLAEGSGSSSRFDLFQVRDIVGLSAIGGLSPDAARPWEPVDADDKWTEALLRPDAAQIYAELTGGQSFTHLAAWGDTDLGMVTGNNRFFTMTAAEATALGLSPEELKRISPPGSRHLRGLTFTERAFDEMAAVGGRVYLFYPDKERPSDAAKRYIALGERAGVHRAYKCAVRSPWWRVPTVRTPDLFLTYMNHDAPRLVSNQARAAHLNSIHGVTLKASHRELGADLLPIGMLNSVTMLGAELVGRSYGGGILKIEPKEADRLPMPSPALLSAAAAELLGLRSRLAVPIGSSQLDEVVHAVDEALRLGDLGALRDARQRMSARRAARAARPRGAGRSA
jgi:adenine-specific DNA-methyltransferase